MKIGHFPQHMGENLEQNLVSIRSLGMTFAGMTEQDFGRSNTFHRIRNTVGLQYRILSKDEGGHSQETPILMRRRSRVVWKIESIDVDQLSPELPGPGAGNDRWQFIVRLNHRFKKKRRLMLIWTHWNAAIQDRETGLPLKHNIRFQVMDERAGRSLDRAIKAGRREDRTIVVGMDANYRVKGRSANWFYAPENIFRRNRLRFINSGLDYLAWTKDIAPVGGAHIIPVGGMNGSDHPWLWGDFRYVHPLHRQQPNTGTR